MSDLYETNREEREPGRGIGNEFASGFTAFYSAGIVNRTPSLLIPRFPDSRDARQTGIFLCLSFPLEKRTRKNGDGTSGEVSRKGGRGKKASLRAR